MIDSNPFFSAANFSALLAIPGDLYIANNLQFLSANFMRVTRIDGSLSLINNNVFTSVVLSSLTMIVGQLVFNNNPRFPQLVTPKLGCQPCTTPACWTMYMDALICPVIVGDRAIRESSATNLTNPVLTRAEGYLNMESNVMLIRVEFASLTFVGGPLEIQRNNMLTRVDFTSLTYVGGYLYVAGSPALTFASLPRLSRVQSWIAFCQNAPSFVIPNPASGTAAPPGLTSVTYKGQLACSLQNGSGVCAAVTCP